MAPSQEGPIGENQLQGQDIMAVANLLKVEIGLLGGLFMDQIGRADCPLEPDTSTPGRVIARPGGVAGNVARLLAALGHQVALGGAIGRDGNGAALRSLYEAEGIDTEAVVEVDAPTGCYLALHQPNGSLLAALADAGAVEAFTRKHCETLPPALLSADLWFLDANLPVGPLSLLMARAHALAKPMAVDCVSAAKAPRLAPHLDKVQLLFGNLAELRALFGDQTLTAQDAMALALKAGPTEVVLTLGSQGFLVGSRQGVWQKSALLSPLKDVTGAGDAVIAAYLSARRQGKSQIDAADWAARAAAIALGQEGCVPTAFSRAQLDAPDNQPAHLFVARQDPSSAPQNPSTPEDPSTPENPSTPEDPSVTPEASSASPEASSVGPDDRDQYQPAEI